MHVVFLRINQKQFWLHSVQVVLLDNLAWLRFSLPKVIFPFRRLFEPVQVVFGQQYIGYVDLPEFDSLRLRVLALSLQSAQFQSLLR